MMRPQRAMVLLVVGVGCLSAPRRQAAEETGDPSETEVQGETAVGQDGIGPESRTDAGDDPGVGDPDVAEDDAAPVDKVEFEDLPDPGTDEEAETEADVPPDGEGEGADTEDVPDVCMPSWSCTVWAACTCSNLQTRTCTDSNGCGVTTGKPGESQTCDHCGNGACDCGETYATCPGDGCCAPEDTSRVLGATCTGTTRAG